MKKLFLITALIFLHSSFCFSAEKEDLAGRLEVNGIVLDAKIKGTSLIFTLKNLQNIDLLVDDEFCFDLKMKNFLLDEKTFKMRNDYFSSGLIHGQKRMKKLKANSEYNCQISYFTEAENVSESGVALVFWHTNLLIGDYDGNYVSKRFMGVIPVTLPVGISDDEPISTINELSKNSYLRRKSLGIKE